MKASVGSRFTVIEQIGGGNYGTLFRVMDEESPTLADRIIATKKLKDALNHPHVLREISVQHHAQQHSPHIAKLLHVVPRDGGRAALVLEYVPMDLRAFLNAFYCDRVHSAAPTWNTTAEEGWRDEGTDREGVARSSWQPPTHLPLSYVKSMLRGLLDALRCLHARGIAHRDVKPENILVEPLGLQHPLRCVCPPPPETTPASFVCRVHASHRHGDGAPAPKDTGGPEGEVNEEQRSGGSSKAYTERPPQPLSQNPTLLEPCRHFFHESVALHHELTGDDLARTIHLLHCRACRQAACVEADKGNGASSDGFHTIADGAAKAPSRAPQRPNVAADHRASTDEAALQRRAEEEQQCDGAWRPRSPSSAVSPPLSPDVKLCDFGSARHIGTLRLRSAEEQCEELTPGPTTPVYCAPEMMLLQRYGTPVDMWAVGAVFFEMLTGEFFLSVGTVRSFYGDLVLHDDYCVIHRLNMMFRHLGTPSPVEWRVIAHPLYYPMEALAHMPQIPQSSLFRCHAKVTSAQLEDEAALMRRLDLAGDEEEHTAENSAPRHPRESSAVGAQQRETEAQDKEEEGDEEQQYQRGEHNVDTTQTKALSVAAATTLGDDMPDISEFLLHHIGVSGLDLLRSLLRYDPTERITAEAALRHPFLQMKERAAGTRFS